MDRKKLTMTNFKSIFLLLGLAIKANSYASHPLARSVKSSKNTRGSALFSSRRNFITQSTAVASFSSLLTVLPKNANAGIDPNALKSYQITGDTTGVRTRLSQIEGTKTRASDADNTPYEVLPSGVSYREFREGKGEVVVQSGSKVAVEMTIRCKSFSTTDEPGGVKYFSTKADTEFNEVAWTIGSGELIPGLEEAMIGMHRNAVRRIEIPSVLVFEANKNGQLPLPSEKNKNGKRIYERLFKTDATLLIEVLATRIK